MSNPTVPFYPMTHDDAQELIAAIGDNSKLAAPYDATRTYAVNEHCIYGGNVNRCKIPINTPEQWTPGHWEQITIGDELTENSQGLAKLIPVITGNNNNSGYTIASGDYFEANGALYLATGSIPNGYPWSSSAQAVSGTAVNALNGNIAAVDGRIPNVHVMQSESATPDHPITFNPPNKSGCVFITIPTSLTTANTAFGYYVIQNNNAVFLMVSSSPLVNITQSGRNLVLSTTAQYGAYAICIGGG